MKKCAICAVICTIVVALIVLVWPRSELPVASRQDFKQVLAYVENNQHLENKRDVLLALGGSQDAASRLIEIYDNCLEHADPDSARSELCWQEVKRWTEIGLQNGSPIAAQIKVNELLQSQVCYDIYRAEYWLMQYREAGLGNEKMWKADAMAINNKKLSCSW